MPLRCILLLILMLLASVPAVQATPPVTVDVYAQPIGTLSPEVRQTLGDDARVADFSADAEFRPFADRLSHLVTRLGRSGDEVSRIRIVVINSADPNAFFSLGHARTHSGEWLIGVTTGLLNFVESDDELAFVLGHEMEHGRSRLQEKVDTIQVKTLEDEMKQRLLQRVVENEVDLQSVLQRMIPADLDPYAARRFLGRLEERFGGGPSTSHTSTRARIDVLDLATAAMRRIQGENVAARVAPSRHEVLGQLQEGLLRTPQYRERVRAQVRALAEESFSYAAIQDQIKKTLQNYGNFSTTRKILWKRWDELLKMGGPFFDSNEWEDIEVGLQRRFFSDVATAMTEMRLAEPETVASYKDVFNRFELVKQAEPRPIHWDTTRHPDDNIASVQRNLEWLEGKLPQHLAERPDPTTAMEGELEEWEAKRIQLEQRIDQHRSTLQINQRLKAEGGNPLAAIRSTLSDTALSTAERIYEQAKNLTPDAFHDFKLNGHLMIRGSAEAAPLAFPPEVHLRFFVALMNAHFGVMSAHPDSFKLDGNSPMWISRRVSGVPAEEVHAAVSQHLNRLLEIVRTPVHAQAWLQMYNDLLTRSDFPPLNLPEAQIERLGQALTAPDTKAESGGLYDIIGPRGSPVVQALLERVASRFPVLDTFARLSSSFHKTNINYTQSQLRARFVGNTDYLWRRRQIYGENRTSRQLLEDISTLAPQVAALSREERSRWCDGQAGNVFMAAIDAFHSASTPNEKRNILRLVAEHSEVLPLSWSSDSAFPNPERAIALLEAFVTEFQNGMTSNDPIARRGWAYAFSFDKDNFWIGNNHQETLKNIFTGFKTRSREIYGRRVREIASQSGGSVALAQAFASVRSAVDLLPPRSIGRLGVHNDRGLIAMHRLAELGFHLPTDLPEANRAGAVLALLQGWHSGDAIPSIPMELGYYAASPLSSQIDLMVHLMRNKLASGTEFDHWFRSVWTETANNSSLRIRFLENPEFVRVLTFDDSRRLLALAQLEHRFPSESVPQGVLRKARSVITEVRQWIETQIPEASSIRDEVISAFESKFHTNPAETRFLGGLRLNERTILSNPRLMALDLPQILASTQGNSNRLSLLRYFIGLDHLPDAKLPRRAELPLARQAFLTTDLLTRTYIIQSLISGPSGIAATDSGRDTLMGFVLRENAGHELYQSLAKAYLESVPEGEASVVMARVLAGQADGNASRFSLRALLEAMGPLGIRAGQVLRTTGLVGPEHTADLTEFLDRADRPERPEIIGRMKDAFGRALVGVESIEGLLGSGSLNWVVRAKLKDPATGEIKTVAVRVLRERAKARIASEAWVWQRTAERLRASSSASAHRTADVLSEVLAGAMETLGENGSEFNLGLERAAYSLADRAYRSDQHPKTGYRTRTYQPLDALQSLVRPEHQSTVSVYELIEGVRPLEVNPPTLRSALGLQIMEAELDALLNRGVFDPDGHPGNWLVDVKGRSLVRLDTAQVTEIPTAERNMVREAITLLLEPRPSRQQLDRLAELVPSLMEGLPESGLEIRQVITDAFTADNFPEPTVPHERLMALRLRLDEAAPNGGRIRLRRSIRVAFNALGRIIGYRESIGDKAFQTSFLRHFGYNRNVYGMEMGIRALGKSIRSHGARIFRIERMRCAAQSLRRYLQNL